MSCVGVSRVSTFPFHFQQARTEWIKNTRNPRFSKAIEIDYRFEEIQHLRCCKCSQRGVKKARIISYASRMLLKSKSLVSEVA